MDDYYYIYDLLVTWTTIIVNIAINIHFTFTNNELNEEVIDPVEYCKRMNVFFKIEAFLNAVMFISYIVAPVYIEPTLVIVWFTYYIIMFVSSTLRIWK